MRNGYPPTIPAPGASGTIRSRIARNRESLGLTLPKRYATLSEEKTEYTQLMKKYIAILKKHIAERPPDFGDVESVLGMLYECHNENSPYDNEQIKADFNELYQQMNGMPLR